MRCQGFGFHEETGRQRVELELHRPTDVALPSASDRAAAQRDDRPQLKVRATRDRVSGAGLECYYRSLLKGLARGDWARRERTAATRSCSRCGSSTRLALGGGAQEQSSSELDLWTVPPRAGPLDPVGEALGGAQVSRNLLRNFPSWPRKRNFLKYPLLRGWVKEIIQNFPILGAGPPSCLLNLSPNHRFSCVLGLNRTIFFSLDASIHDNIGI